jgi:hypothetical protein
MSTALTALAIVFVTFGVVSLGALEIWLFWKLGECEARRRAERAGAIQPATSPRERRRGEDARPCDRSRIPCGFHARRRQRAAL